MVKHLFVLILVALTFIALIIILMINKKKKKSFFKVLGGCLWFQKEVESEFDF